MEFDTNVYTSDENHAETYDISLPTKSQSVRAVEGSTLGCMLSSDEACDELLSSLTVDDFYSRPNKMIFKAISMMSQEGVSIDLITVAEYLDERGRLEEVGGLAYIGDIKRSDYVVANADSYSKILVDHRILRTLESVSSAINDIRHGKASPKDKLEKAELLLMGMGQDHSEGPITAGQAVGKLVDLLDSRVDNGEGITGQSTGFEELDKMTSGLQGGDLIIIAGRPSMGKTTLAENIASHCAFSGKSTLFFSLEMGSEQIIQRTFCSRKRVPLSVSRQANFSDLQWSLFTEFVGEVSDDDMRMFIDDSPTMTIADIRSRSRKIHRQHGLSLIVIDYLQLINMTDGENQTLRVGNASRALKQLARELNVPVVVLSQLSRKVEERADKRPLMSDLRESGAIEQDADLILFVYRDEVYNSDTQHKGIAEILIRKQRNGPVGDVFVDFQGEYCRFKDREVNHWGD